MSLPSLGWRLLHGSLMSKIYADDTVYDINSWLENASLSLAEHKTKSTSMKIIVHQPQPVPKYLGVMIDQRLLFKLHIEGVAARTCNTHSEIQSIFWRQKWAYLTGNEPIESCGIRRRIEGLHDLVFERTRRLSNICTSNDLGMTIRNIVQSTRKSQRTQNALPYFNARGTLKTTPGEHFTSENMIKHILAWKLENSFVDLEKNKTGNKSNICRSFHIM